jgi:L-alanine-DL-glutamate epimerase-like enolase superfamily enzyme
MDVTMVSCTYEDALAYVNTHSSPSQLKITDMRFATLEGCPYPAILMKLYTNQGLIGYSEVRDIGSKTYALMLKGRLLGENPCNVDRLFRRIKQFGFHGRQGGGVSAVEIALWDLAGKAFGVPVYQMLGGKFRDSLRIYVDTDVMYAPERSAGQAMGLALKQRMERGFTMLKMDLGIDLLENIPGALNAPLGYIAEKKKAFTHADELFPSDLNHEQKELRRKIREANDVNDLLPRFYARNRAFEHENLLHPFTCIQITEKGLDYLENYVAEVREIIGYEIPLALDHFGKIAVEEIIKLAKRLEKYNIAWLEDPIPWPLTKQWKRLAEATTIPICTGEENFLAESFKPLLEAGGISYAHPDMLTLGGLYETKKLGDLAETYGVKMILHQASSPVHALAAAHAGIATANCVACEWHANDVPWWDEIYIGKMPKPLIKDGFITPMELPGLGIDALNDDLIRENISASDPGLWEPTDGWNLEYSWDKWCN